MSTSANSEDQDEMLHNAAFSSGSALFDKTKDLQNKNYNFSLEIITCDPSIYTMD